MSSNTVTKGNILGKIQAKLNKGDIIGTIAYKRVLVIITKLRSDLAAARSGSNEAIARSAVVVTEAKRATELSNEKARQAGEKAELAEEALQHKITAMNASDEEKFDIGQMMEEVIKTNDIETDTLKKTINDLQAVNNNLTAEKTKSEGELVTLFNEVLKSIDEALSPNGVNSLLTNSQSGSQSGGFQSSSSGNYLKKKYRSSSRSYSNRIKDLKKKRKHSKKIRRDRKKKSKRNKTKKR